MAPNVSFSLLTLRASIRESVFLNTKNTSTIDRKFEYPLVTIQVIPERLIEAIVQFTIQCALVFFAKAIVQFTI